MRTIGVFFFLFFVNVVLGQNANSGVVKSQENPEKIHSWEQVRNLKLDEHGFLPYQNEKTGFGIALDTISGRGVGWFDAELDKWQRRDNYRIIKPTLINLMQLTSVSKSRAISMMQDVGAVVSDDFSITSSNELHLEHDRDLRQWEVFPAAWSAEISAIGSNAVQELRELQLELEYFSYYGLAKKSKGCLLDYDGDGLCQGYRLKFSEGFVLETHFDFLTDKNFWHYEHALESSPESGLVYFRWLVYNGIEVSRPREKWNFVEENGAIITQVDFGFCNPIDFVFDTGASITLINDEYQSCFRSSGKLEHLGEINIQVADGSVVAVDRYYFKGEFRAGGYGFEGFELVFLPNVESLLGESIWGQYDSMDINFKQKTIELK